MFADLQAYICTHSNCPEMLQTFTTRKVWFEHEQTYHFSHLQYRCQLCDKMHSDDTVFLNHSFESHNIQSNTSNLRAALLATASRLVMTEPKDLRCSLCCQSGWARYREYATHVGKHLESIALCALPPSANDDSENEDPAADHSSAVDIESSVQEDELSQNTLSSGTLSSLPPSPMAEIVLDSGDSADTFTMSQDRPQSADLSAASATRQSLSQRPGGRSSERFFCPAVDCNHKPEGFSKRSYCVSHVRSRHPTFLEKYYCPVIDCSHHLEGFSTRGYCQNHMQKEHSSFTEEYPDWETMTMKLPYVRKAFKSLKQLCDEWGTPESSSKRVPSGAESSSRYFCPLTDCDHKPEGFTKRGYCSNHIRIKHPYYTESHAGWENPILKFAARGNTLLNKARDLVTWRSESNMDGVNNELSSTNFSLDRFIADTDKTMPLTQEQIHQTSGTQPPRFKDAPMGKKSWLEQPPPSEIMLKAPEDSDKGASANICSEEPHTSGVCRAQGPRRP